MKLAFTYVFCVFISNLISNYAYADARCEQWFYNDVVSVSSNVISLDSFRDKALRAAAEDKKNKVEGKAKFLGIDPKALQAQQDLKLIQDFLFNSTTVKTGFLFIAAHGQMKGNNIGTWPITFKITINPDLYGRLFIQADVSEKYVLRRINNKIPALSDSVEFIPGTYPSKRYPGMSYTSRVLAMTDKILTIEGFFNDGEYIKTITFIKNSNKVLQEIRFSMPTFSEKIPTREARFLIEQANPDIQPY